MRLAVLSSHPIQYYAPLFRALSRRVDLQVFFAHRATPDEQAAAGFGTAFDWDIDLTGGYPNAFLRNVAAEPGAARFAGCDTPEIGEVLRRGRFEAVLALGWHLKSMLQGIWAAKRAGLRVMVRGDSHLDTPRSPLKRAVKAIGYPIFLRVFDAALFVGERNRAYYEHYRYPARRLFRSPHCVDTERFGRAATEAARRHLRTRLGVAPATRLVLFAGKLVDFKRPLDAVDALALLRREGADAALLVAGAGPLEALLRARAAEAGVPLHPLGFRNQTEMPEAYAAADALVLPSDGRESWGLVCNEALACGCPIVVSDAVGCAPDLAADGEVGRTFPLGEPRALAAALAALFAAPPPRAAIEAVSARFSIDRAVEGIIAAAAGRGVP